MLVSRIWVDTILYPAEGSYPTYSTVQFLNYVFRQNTVAHELSGVVVSRLDFCAGDPGSIPAGAEFPTGI